MADREGWFSKEEEAGLADFWSVYRDNFAALHDQSELAAKRRDPRLAELFEVVTAERTTAPTGPHRGLVERAIAGDWTDYLSFLHERGAAFARQGVAYGSWWWLMRVLARKLALLLQESYSTEPTRLGNSLMAMQAFLDRAILAIGDAYIETKQTIAAEREENLATTLNSIGDAVIATDTEGRVVRLNPVAEQLTGWSRDAAVGKPLSEVFHIINETTRDPVPDPVERVLRLGSVVGLANHTLLVAVDGSECPIADSAAPIRNSDGELTGVVLVFRDQSAEQEAARQLQESEERFRTLTQTTTSIVWTTAPDGAFVAPQPGWEAYTGQSWEEHKGFGWAAAIHEDDRPNVQQLWQQALEKGVVYHSDGRLWHAPTGTYRRFVATAAPLRNPDGTLREWIGTVTDIEDQRIAQLLRAENRRINEASRLKSEFLANMSHELRTPLNSIIGFAELLHDGEVGALEPKQEEFIGDILASGRHLLQLINDVLDLSKVEAGKMEFHPEPLDLSKIFSEVLSILRTAIARKGLEVNTSVAADLGEVVLDASRLKQVLYNYLSNALKFTGARGSVSVRAVPEGESWVRIEVEDTGVGIAREDIERLFTEFEQLDGSAGKIHGGTGLGLALTRRLVEAQGGRVGVTSEPNKGSRFYAVLPRRGEGDVRPASTQSGFRAGLPGAPTVLVVEDDSDDQAKLRRLLTEAGYEVDVASTGAEALARSAERTYAAITLDLLLPDMSGLDVLREIRRAGRNTDSTVVIVTIVAEHATGGFVVHDVLSKPVESVALLESLARAGVEPSGPSTVMVVDDDSSSLKLMATVLEQLGFLTACYDDPRRALAALATERPHAVVLDLLMPQLDGFEFLARLRESPGGMTVPVLVWTMKDLTSAELETLYTSAQAVLAKTRGSAELTEALRACLGVPASTVRHGP